MAQIILGEGDSSLFVKCQEEHFLHKEIIVKSKNALTIFKNLLPKKQQAKFNQTYYK
jgi:hypothetical protein